MGWFQCIQELRVIGGKNNPVPEATAILVKSLKAVRKFPAKNEDSGLKSGSRERCLPQSFEALNIRFKIPVQEEFISCKKLKVAEEDLLP